MFPSHDKWIYDYVNSNKKENANKPPSTTTNDKEKFFNDPNNFKDNDEMILDMLLKYLSQYFPDLVKDKEDFYTFEYPNFCT